MALVVFMRAVSLKKHTLFQTTGAELGAVEYVKPGVYVAMLGYGTPYL